ncbi:MAG: hypothetical protein M1829_001025 [Trizodia sp. TS-e1964]|nr:MAG: hypothetical protein M1829_001025 [Trizodia sp. TS-e1964]
MDVANEAVLKVSRGTSVILLLVYSIYIFFQLKTHRYLFTSAQQNIFDEESHIRYTAGPSSISIPGAAIASLASDTDGLQRVLSEGMSSNNAFSNGNFPTPKEVLVFENVGQNHLQQEGQIISQDFEMTPITPQYRPHILLSGETPDGDPKLSVNGPIGQETPAVENLMSLQHSVHNPPTDVTLKPSPTQSPLFSHGSTLQQLGPKTKAIDSSTPVSILRALSNSSPRNPNLSHTNPISGVPATRTTRSLSIAVPNDNHPTHLEIGDVNDDSESANQEKYLSLTSAVILLLCSTALVALCAEFLVGSINDLISTGGVSEAFIGLIVLPIVGNAAEHVTAVVMAHKNKVDLALNVALGSSIQIALFVTPIVILLGWALQKDMTLYFSLFETVSLFAATFIVNFLVLDGRSNYLEGVLLCAAYVIIAVAAFFYPDSSEQASAGGFRG